MQYPRQYAVIENEEMTYLSGGTAMDAFNYLFGDYLRNKVLADFQKTTWNTLQQVSLAPVRKWGQSFWDFSIFAKGAYLYGVFHLFEKVAEQLDKT